jgi:hypothetical protein
MPKYMSDTEHKILQHLIDVAELHGYTVVSVDDGGDIAEPVTSKEEAIEAVDAVEMSSLRFVNESHPSFWVGVILGNGRDLIHDYPDRPEVDRIMEQVQDYAESLGD